MAAWAFFISGPAMLVVIQHPLADLRQLLIEDTGRITSPDWPRPQPHQFIRGFGQIEERGHGGIQGWIGENFHCASRNVLRFVDLPPFYYATDGDTRRIVPKVCFRRFFSDGLISCKAETGLRTVPYSIGLAGQWFSKLIAHFISLPVALEKVTQHTVQCSLRDAGKSLAVQYLRASTKASFGAPAKEQLHWIKALEPLVFVEYYVKKSVIPPLEEQQLLHGVEGITLVHARLVSQDHFTSTRVWLLGLDAGYSRDVARTLRIALLRMHAEKQCLDLVLNLIRRDHLQIEPGSTQELVLAHFFNLATRRLLRSEKNLKRGGADVAVQVARQFEETATYGESVQLKEKLDQILVRHPNIRNKMREYVDDEERSSQQPTFYVETLLMARNIVSVTGNNNITTVDANLQNVQQQIGSFSTLAEDQKKQLKELVEEFRKELVKVGDDHLAEADLISRRLEEVVASAAKPPEQRKKGILEISVNGLKDAAKTVAAVVPTLLPVAEKIAAFVLGLAIK